MPETECQKFFALSKRVPKDVKRFCGICRQHGVLEETRGHSCQFRDCACNKCQLVRTRRQIMSQQIRLRRAQDKRFQRTNEPQKADVVPIKLVNDELATMIAATSAASNSNGGNITFATSSADELLSDAKNMCYFCQKCKNHEILVWKKQHKRQCPFTDCVCEKCELIETRRRLDQHMKKRKAALKAAANGNHSIDLSSILSPPQSILTSPSPKNSIAHSPDFSHFLDHHQNDALAIKSLQNHQEAAIKIEETFMQQKPVFSVPQSSIQETPQNLSQIPQNLSQVSLPQISLAPFFLPTASFGLTQASSAFLPVSSSTITTTATPSFILTQNDFLAAAVANMNAAHKASPPLPQNFYEQFLVKTVTPPVVSSVEMVQQSLPQVSMPQIQSQIQSQSLPQVSMPQPALTFKEMEQMLMLKYQLQQQGIH